ncbi:MAG: hypothetical protein HYS33_01525 [Acidobacteria bacterium]|nr:hypothetical protein [Acidobacteriota bacterium]
MTKTWALFVLVFCAAPALAPSRALDRMVRGGAGFALAGDEFPPNQWVEISRDARGARRGSAIRYVPEADAFFLWGFMNDDPDQLQEHPLQQVPEYDMVFFSLADGRWRNHLPPQWEELWGKKLPLSFIPRTYSGITTGSERTVLRGLTDELEGVPRPDLNIVFDQVTYHPKLRSLVYFSGGLTAAYHVAERRWSDLSPRHSPPPVLGGSLAYDPVNDEVVLFGGGHVAEPGPDGRVVGYTGTWAYKDHDWRKLDSTVMPSPRMNTRMVCDTRRQALVAFGGDGQSHYLGDTWIYDLKTRRWRKSQARGGPEPRAGHFTVYDPQTGWVIVGGGYNRHDLTDAWAYDAGEDRWQRLRGKVPIGFYITADLTPEKRTIVLVTNTQKPDDPMTCNVLYPVRTTYAYRIDPATIVLDESQSPAEHPPMAKRAVDAVAELSARERQEQSERLRGLPENRWVRLEARGQAAIVRTWGSATFDTHRGLILYWGGGHCGYGGNDVAGFDVEAGLWRSFDAASEFPERTWDKGVRLAGVTFQGKPWTEHGRRIYAYDPLSRKLVMTWRIRLTTGYDPELLRHFSSGVGVAPDALASQPSSYVRYATWTFDPDKRRWELLGPAPPGVDTLVSTRRGVMGVNVNWPSRLNDAGYLLPWRPSQPAQDTAIYLLDVSQKKWTRLDTGPPSPQNLYEVTSLAYDSKRDRVLLHGGGQDRDELWAFDIQSGAWANLQPTVAGPAGGQPPVASREAVYLPHEDVMLTYGPSREDATIAALWVYSAVENVWRRMQMSPPPGIEPRLAAGQNRALVYDPKHDLVLMVLGAGGEEGRASVYALRYRHSETRSGLPQNEQERGTTVERIVKPLVH